MNDELVRHGLLHVLARVSEHRMITELPYDRTTVSRLKALKADLIIIGAEAGASLTDLARLSPTARIVAITDGEDRTVSPLQLIRDGAHALIDRRTSSSELVATILRVTSGQHGLDVSNLDAIFAEIRATKSDADAATYSCLTRREREVLKLVTDGLDNRAIAANLFVSEATVKFHVHNIMSKLGIHKRSALVADALRRSEPHRTFSVPRSSTVHE
ncbi:hypothetical protein AN948_05200 [Rhodococcus sp. ADH]|uniref:response regulator transcription factor n=2 Tax=Mycobacteriales TaxID=85007 RepID=UPI00068F315A|nr:response regulator transcription factor [Rhodococcus sp. ADH]KPH20758.1 hypothetical protein AN948_05200 [Rhodococcus sp. ADH]MCY4667952.1 response regulator transcription factor [Rhodococcus sp. (in: high G+C Gram-positive bacteria)]RGP48021.1 hypothetical protein AWH04_16670 [Rhodococcus erythropolis]